MRQDDKKLERAEWIAGVMTRYGYPEVRVRSAAIRKATGASPNVANGWLRGSLPKDMLMADQFCDAFDTDMRSWVHASDKPVTEDYRQEKEIRDAVFKAKTFEEEMGHLTPETFVEVFSVIYKESRGEMSLDDALGLMALNQEKKVNGGTARG